MLKVILFDIDNTLLSFDEYVRDSMRRGFQKFGIGTYEDAMFSVFHKINSKLWRSIEEGKITFEELQEIRWNKIFDALGLSADGVLFERYFRECLFDSAIPESGATEILEYLHGKYTLCVASNGPYKQQVNRLKVGGMLPYFSELFISEEIGFSKPSEEFFNTCIERLNKKSAFPILPSEILIIGDSLTSDMAGGIQCGMQTCLYDPDKKALPPEMKINYVISSLQELKSIL